MNMIRVLVCSVGLVIALAPTMSAFAQGNDADHQQAELQNAAAQYQLALDQANQIQAQAQLSAENERTIAFLQSEEMRQHQLDLSANGNAIEQIGAALANAARAQGDLSAQNELQIQQIRASVLVAKADATLANALAQNRQTEIDNARAQSSFLHQLADFITSTLAETNMSNAKQIGQARADMIHTPTLAGAANGTAMAAAEVFAADQVLQAATISASSSTLSGSTKAAAIVSHAADSLKNAQAMAAAASSQ
jgi:hypothetical protein